tara:strand:- start:2360 stop:3418 length:1059 start_codon:yes stop_codon:yes gene_type:complete
MNKAQISSIQEKIHTIDINALAKEIFTEDEFKEYIRHKKGDNSVGSYIKDVTKRVLPISDLKKVRVEAIIENAPPEFANALQRATTSEQFSYSLEVKYENIQTTDKDINKTELLDNITFIPLRYGISEIEFFNLEFSLDIRNEGNHIKPVLAGDLKVKGHNLTKPLFHPTIELIYLRPECHLVIENITISKGTMEDHAKYMCASNGSTWPLDRPVDAKTTNFTPMKHRISFNINTVLVDEQESGKKLLRTGCQNLIQRLTLLLDIINSEDSSLYFEEYKDHSQLALIETNSIGMLLERACYILYPKIEYVSANICYHTMLMTFVVYGPDSKNMVLSTIRECIKMYQRIHEQI